MKVFSVFKNPWLSFVLNGRRLQESCVNLINVFVGYKVTKYVRRRKRLSTNIGFIRPIKLLTRPLCLKITEKVSFNIASEASYVYFLRGEKFILECYQRSVSIGQKLAKNARIKNFKCGILGNFQTMCKTQKSWSKRSF